VRSLKQLTKYRTLQNARSIHCAGPHKHHIPLDNDNSGILKLVSGLAVQHYRCLVQNRLCIWLVFGVSQDITTPICGYPANMCLVIKVTVPDSVSEKVEESFSPTVLGSR